LRRERRTTEEKHKGSEGKPSFPHQENDKKGQKRWPQTGGRRARKGRGFTRRRFEREKKTGEEEEGRKF